jgi:hypothetical protein
LIVQPHLAPTFHPQNAPAIASDGEWSAIVYFGESPSRNIGERFELIAISANEEGSRAIAAYLEQAAEDGSFPGLAFLPEGTELQDQITVTRE